MRFSANIFIPGVLVFVFLMSSFGITALLIYSSLQTTLGREISSKIALLQTVRSTLYSPEALYRQGLGPGFKRLVINQASKAPRVVFVRIFNPNTEQIFLSATSEEIGMKVSNLPPASSNPTVREGLFEGKTVKEISIAGTSNEVLWMGIDIQPLINNALRNALLAGASIVGLMMVLYFLIFFMLQRLLLGPTREIIDVVEQFGRGNLNIRVSRPSLLKEAAMVADSLNAMMDRTKEQREREQMLSRMKTEFISIAAHQLRTPLSAIKWTFQMLLAGDIGKLTKEQRNFISQSNETNERMIELINDLLNVSRIEEGKFGFRFKEASLVPLIRNIINEDNVRMGQKNISFELKGALGEIPALKIDSEKITMAFSNILDNAIKYTLPGGRITVKVDFTDDKQYVLVSVQDTGVGIPEGQMNKLFTKFFRGRNAILMQTEGTGLGLFLVKNIIERHGGKIWAESEEGKGSIFYFTLPLEEAMIPSEEEFRSFVREF